MSRRRCGAGGLAASLVLAATLSSGARADNEQDAERRDNLIALLMVEESARICSFALADKALQHLVAARAALVQALKLDDPQLAKLRPAVHGRARRLLCAGRTVEEGRRPDARAYAGDVGPHRPLHNRPSCFDKLSMRAGFSWHLPIDQPHAEPVEA